MAYLSLQQGRIGLLDIPNRIVLPAMVTNYCTEKGEATPRFIRYHEERAAGGAGLLIMEATCICREGRSFPRQLSIEHDSLLPSLRLLTQAVHRQGARIAVQLYHAGRQTSHALTASPLLGPSEVCFGNETTRAMTEKDIESVIASFVQAARRAKEAGFDAVELHAAHGYLMQQFLSRFTNKRTDVYGGSLRNRALFSCRIIEAVRAETGSSFPIILRLSVEEPVTDGLTLEEGVEAACIFADAGVDALHISAGMREAGMWVTPPQALPLGTHALRAKAVREATGGRVPIITVGRIYSMAQADQLLQEGVADFVAMGRALLADAHLPRKTVTGQTDTIRPCLACNEGCIGQLARGMDVACAVNPTLGREHQTLLTPSPSPGHVIVVGGGPAGLVAACTARLRGHVVTLLEKEPILGGKLLVASMPPHKSELRRYAAYLERRAQALGVVLCLGQEVEAEDIVAMQPDHVLVAVGGLPRIPSVSGLDSEEYVTAEQALLSGGAGLASSVVVAGGGLVGCETAEFLALRRHKVTVLEMRQDMALDMEPRSRMLLLQRLRDLDVTLCANTRLHGISAGHVQVENMNGVGCLSEPASLVLAAGYLPDKRLSRALCAVGVHAVEIGDCASAGRILEAVHQGFSRACTL